MRSALIGLAVVFAGSLASAGMARTIYDCTLDELSNNRGWVPSEVIVSYDDETGAVQVVDGFIQHVKGGPIDVEPSTDTDGVLALSWKLTLESTRGNSIPVRFEFSITKSNNRAKMRSVPLGYDNDWASRGSCKVTKG